MNRITKKGAMVWLTFEPTATKLWADYFPVYLEYDLRVFPPLKNIIDLIQLNTPRTVEIFTLMLPHDLTDMFAAAGWRRPEIYLNADVRAGRSALVLSDVHLVEKGVKILKEDLHNRVWDA